MKIFNWDNDKNEKLKLEKGVSFEHVVFCIENEQLLDIIKHPNKEKYKNQKMYVVKIDDYVYIVPFVDKNSERFLKTNFPAGSTQNFILSRRGKMIKLDIEEQKLSESVERGGWQSVENLDEEIAKSKEYAKNTFIKNQRMNIRISEKDLNALKIRAAEEGLPYQTLVSSIIHKYLSNNLFERKSIYEMQETKPKLRKF